MRVLAIIFSACLGLLGQDFQGTGAFSVTDATKLHRMEQQIWEKAAKTMRIPCGVQVTVMEDAMWAQKRAEVELNGRSVVVVMREWFGAQAKSRCEVLSAHYGASDPDSLRARLPEEAYSAYVEWDSFMRALGGALRVTDRR